MCLLVLSTIHINKAHTSINNHIQYDNATMLNDNTIFYDTDSGYYRKCEVIPEPIPEPSTILMLAAGLGIIGLALIRRKENKCLAM